MPKLTLIILLVFYSLGYCEELQSFSTSDYLNQNPSTEAKAIANSLQEQFKDKQVSQLELDNLWNKEEIGIFYKMSRFQIINQKLYANSYSPRSYYFSILVKYFQHLINKYHIPDVDFVIYMVEQMPYNAKYSKPTLSVPAFIMFQDLNRPTETNKLIFPDAKFLAKDWNNLLNSVKKIPWESKINKIFWRGNASGEVPYNIKNISELTRMKLVMLSRIFPKYIDAKFDNYSSQFSNDKSGRNLKKAIDILNLKTDHKINILENLQYKYLISVDGSEATGTMLPWIMSSNSLLLKPNSDKLQWFYPALKENFHYVSLKHDLTDIHTKFLWLESNQDKIAQIIKNANLFVTNNLSPEAIDAQIMIILREYSKIQKDKKLTPSLSKAEDSMNFNNLLKNWWLFIKLKVRWSLEKWF
jgi:hypothetical protein